MIKEFKSSKNDFLALLLPSDFDEIGGIEKMIDGERFVSYYNDHEKEDIDLLINVTVVPPTLPISPCKDSARHQPYRRG